MKQPPADLTLTREITVTPEATLTFPEAASAPPVYPTFELARHFEELAREMIAPLLEDGEIALGFEIALQHVNNALLGMDIHYKAEFAAFENERFTVNVYANTELGDLIGRGHATLRLFSRSKYEAGLEKLEQRQGEANA